MISSDSWVLLTKYQDRFRWIFSRLLTDQMYLKCLSVVVVEEIILSCLYPATATTCVVAHLFYFLVYSVFSFRNLEVKLENHRNINI